MAFLPAPLRTRLAERADRFALRRFAWMAEQQLGGRAHRAEVHAALRNMVEQFARSTASGPVELAVARISESPEGRRAIADAFSHLYQPAEVLEVPDERVQHVITEAFQRLYYHDASSTWLSTSYRGVKTLKCPLDLWLYQELLHSLRPGLIVETGTAYGGSAYFLADLCAAIGTGRILTIDIDVAPERPKHPLVTYLKGSSTSAAVIDEVARHLPHGEPVMVILDSDHAQAHVLEELRLLSRFVTSGSYLIVEDTIVGGHPVLQNFGPGPMEAVDAFLLETDEFSVDEGMHKLHLTFNPRGYLRRR